VVPDDRRIVLEIGSAHREVRIVRLVASGIGSLAGLDVEAIEDLRIAVDEACVWLIDRGDGGRLHLSFDLAPDGVITVTGEIGIGPSPGDPALGALVEQILAASCAEHHFETSVTHARFVVVARTSVPIAGEAAG